MLQIPYEYATAPTYFKFLKEQCTERNDIAFCAIHPKGMNQGQGIDMLVVESLSRLPMLPAKVIIDDFTEANDAELIDRMISSLTAIGIRPENILYIHGGEDVDQFNWLSYPTFYREFKLKRLSQYIGNSVPWAERDKIFVSLARRPTWFRVAVTEQFIKRNLLDYGMISCGSDSPELSVTDWRTLWVSPEFQSQFPFLLDGQLSSDEELQKETLYLSNAFVNVVSETSHNKNPRFQEIFNELYTPWPNSSFHWTRPFITEKTLKPYAMHQLPVFNTVKHHVRNLRSMGIDVFDDIIDHSYDELDDPLLRIQAVGAEVERLCNLGIDYFKNLDLSDRFVTARERFSAVETFKLNRFEQQLADFIRK